MDAGVARVGFDAGDYESVKRYLHWEDSASDDYTFQEMLVAEISGEEVVLGHEE